MFFPHSVIFFLFFSSACIDYNQEFLHSSSSFPSSCSAGKTEAEMNVIIRTCFALGFLLALMADVLFKCVMNINECIMNFDDYIMLLYIGLYTG